MLTRKQLDLLEFIHKRVQRDGVPPSFDEMKEALDLRSKSGIHRLITALEERGFIRRLAHRARALEVVRLPESLGGPANGFAPRVIDGDRNNIPQPASAMPVSKAQAMDIPVMGRIAAGLRPVGILEGRRQADFDIGQFFCFFDQRLDQNNRLTAAGSQKHSIAGLYF